MRSGVITLTTDFDTLDPYVGMVKGVILGINSSVNIVDIVHHIKPQDVRAAAFLLATCIDWFPAGSVHVAVVDAGVGGRRRAIAVQSERHFYVGPDNGVLSLALRRDRPVGIVELRPGPWTLERVCKTFHGRDIFAPAAAHISKGVPLENLGPVVTDYHELDIGRNLIEGHKAQTSIVHEDSFGNLVTLLHAGEVKTRPLSVKIGDVVVPVKSTFSEVGEGELLAYWGSSDYLEIAANGGSARELLGVGLGQPVSVVLAR